MWSGGEIVSRCRIWHAGRDLITQRLCNSNVGTAALGCPFESSTSSQRLPADSTLTRNCKDLLSPADRG
jgi:hypothetical protein